MFIVVETTSTEGLMKLKKERMSSKWVFKEIFQKVPEKMVFLSQISLSESCYVGDVQINNFLENSKFKTENVRFYFLLTDRDYF